MGISTVSESEQNRIRGSNSGKTEALGISCDVTEIQTMYRNWTEIIHLFYLGCDGNDFW